MNNKMKAKKYAVWQDETSYLFGSKSRKDVFNFSRFTCYNLTYTYVNFFSIG